MVLKVLMVLVAGRYPPFRQWQDMKMCYAITLSYVLVCVLYILYVMYDRGAFKSHWP